MTDYVPGLPTGERLLPADTTPLTDEERARLAVCEAAVSENIGAWVNVTNALAEIHDRRLYRETHPTFGAYLREQWGVSRAQGYRLTLATRVVASPIGDRIKNEAQAREVASLLDDPEHLMAVVDRAEELRAGKPLTAAALRQARAELLAPPEEQETLRAAWTMAELTDEVLAEGERQRQVSARVWLALPPETWPEYGRRFVKSVPTGESGPEWVRISIERLVMDADLTPEVIEVIRRALDHGHLSSVGQAFHDVDGMVRQLTDLSHNLDRRDSRLNRLLSAMWRNASAEGATIVSARLAAVVTALATEPRTLHREWTPEEVKEARARIRRHEPRGRPYVPGPVSGFIVVAADALQMVVAALRGGNEPRAVPPAGDAEEDA